VPANSGAWKLSRGEIVCAGEDLVGRAGLEPATKGL
jgi:hypothetical protein